MLTFLKALDISKAAAHVAQKKGHIPPGDQKYYYLQVFQRLY